MIQHPQKPIQKQRSQINECQLVKSLSIVQVFLALGALYSIYLKNIYKKADMYNKFIKENNTIHYAH